MRLVLVRNAYLPSGTLGSIVLPDGRKLFTVERAWLGNRRNESCIPPGVYQCKPFSGEKFKDVFEVCDVPERSYILFHAANYPSQLQGCIAPGLQQVTQRVDEPAVMNSRAAMDVLREAVPDDGFELEVLTFQPEYP